MNHIYIRRWRLAISLGLLFLTLSQPLRAETPAIPERSFLSRVSIGVNLKYYNRPWNNYNEKLETEIRAREFDPSYDRVIGSWEKVHGDLTYNGVLAFKAIRWLSVSLGFELMETSPKTNYEYFNGENGIQRVEHWTHRTFGFGVGARVSKILTHQLNMTASLEINRYQTSLDFDWAWLFSYGDQAWAGRRIEANLRANTIGWTASVGAELKLVDFLSLIAEVSYRMERFDDIRGPATIRMVDPTGVVSEEFDVTEVRLINSPEYFGISAVESTSFSYLLPDHNRFISSPARGFDFSAFGVAAGIRITLSP